MDNVYKLRRDGLMSVEECLEHAKGEITDNIRTIIVIGCNEDDSLFYCIGQGNTMDRLTKGDAIWMTERLKKDMLEGA